MTKKASAKTVTRDSTATMTIRKRRLSNVQTRSGESLTSLEENTLRMNHGLDVGLHQPLPSNAVNAAIRQQLLEIELRAYEATGRHLQRVDDTAAPAEEAAQPARPNGRRSPKDKIVAALNKR